MSLQTNKLTDVFPKHCFWDIDSRALSFEEDKELIIPRALYFTTKDTFSKDIKRLEAYYLKKDIIQILKVTKEAISNEVCELVSKRYNIQPFYRFEL